MLNFTQNTALVLCWMICIHIVIGNTKADNIRIKRIVGGKAAAKPPPDDPVVFTRVYNRYARVEGFRNEKTGIYTFLGLRFAEPPVGQDRFARPRYHRLEGDINATTHGPPCPQPHPQRLNIIIGNEDCLRLDVYTPRMPDESTGLPVYVWIHPGAFRYGSAAQYNAEPLAQSGIIFVPIQYRLGTLGIIGDGTKEFPGNLAIFDMAAALRWVTEYISYFGGDPKQVKVIGHGSGAASAMYLTMSRLPRDGSISGVVAMSGSALSQYATDKEPIQSLQEIAQINECSRTNETEIISCLRAKSIRDIVLKDSQIQIERLQGRGMVRGMAGSVGFNPHVETPDDGRALPGIITNNPEESIRQGNFSTIPLLIGVVKHETGNAISLNNITSVWGKADKFLSFLTDNLYSLTSFLGIKEQNEILNNLPLPGIEAVGNTLRDTLKLPDNLPLLEIVSKITELTTDVFFNLPAIISAQVWGETSSAYFYSFEYLGSNSKGINFLNGLPIVSPQNGEDRNDVIGHGDDLGYIFDANDIEGNPLLDVRITNPEEIQVRQNFIDLLLKFARPDSNDESSIFKRVLMDGKGVPYIKIGHKLDLLTDFRFCELIPWGIKSNPIQTRTCQALAKSVTVPQNIVGNVTSGLNRHFGVSDNSSLINEPGRVLDLFG